MGLVVASCSQLGGSDSSVSGVPFKSSKNGKWGMVTTNGKLLFEDEFKDRPTLAINDRFLVQNGNGVWEIYTQDEKPEKVGDDYVDICSFWEDVTPAVKKNERISIIDKKGKVVKVLEKVNGKEITVCSKFTDGYAVIVAGEGDESAMGIINTSGDITLEPKKYVYVMNLGDGTFIGVEAKNKDKDNDDQVYNIINHKGDVKGSLKGSKYDDVRIASSKDRLLAVEQKSDGESMWGLIDYNGEVVLKPSRKIQSISEYSYKNGYFIFRNEDGSYGVMDKEGETKLRAKYDALSWAGTGDLLWKGDGEGGRVKYELIDLEGETKAKEDYQNVLPFFDGSHALVQISDNSWGVIDDGGEEIKDIPDIYDVSVSTGSESVASDYVDLDAVIGQLKLDKTGLGGFGIDMTPLQLIKNYNENCEAGDQMSTDPYEVGSTDKLTYTKSLSGIDIRFKVYYSAYMTENDWWTSTYSWTTEKPAYVEARIDGHKLRGKQKDLYAKIATKLKSYGSMVKENDCACVIALGGGKGVWAAVDGDKVIVQFIKNGVNDVYIDGYSANETRTGSGYEDEVAADSCAYDEYEYADSCAVDSAAW